MTEWLDVGIRQRGTGGKTIVRDLNQISEASDRADKDLTKLGKNAAIVGGIIGTAIGAVVGGGIVMLYKGFSNAAKSIKETASAARGLGESVDTFSRLEFAARQSDIATKDFAASMEHLQGVQVQAAKPGKEMAKLFQQMGIEAINADGSLRQTSEVMRDVSDLFQKMPDGANKSALAMKLFGNQNRELVKLLSQGSEGLDQMAQKSDELGYTIGDELAADVSKFYDEFDNVKVQMEAMYREALPTLIPYVQELATLLNSQDFKDGFNSIVQGAANAVVWLAKMTTQFTNTITTLAEDVAAARHGAALDDVDRVDSELVRIEARISRLQDWQSKGRIGRAFQGLGPADSFAKGRDRTLGGVQGNAELAAQRELNILTERRGVLLQAQQDNARAAYEAADRAERERVDAMFKALRDAENPKPAAPGINWAGLGRDPAGGKGKTDRSAERELRQLTSAYESLVNAVDPVLAATMKYEDAQDTLAGAVQRGWLEQDKATEYLEQYAYLLRDQLDPMAAVERELNKQIDAAKLLGKERDIEVEVLDRLERLRENGITLTEEETKRLREQVTTLREVNDLYATKERILEGSSARQMEDFRLDLSAFEGIKDRLTEGDKFNWLDAVLGGSLSDAQDRMDLRLEQLDIYYQMVQEFRDQDVANHKLAADAMDAIDRARMDIQVARVQEGLGAISGLMSSHHKEAFRIGQAAAIANATITGIQTAMNAYESASKIPYVGWILGPLAAAGAAAATAAQISQIRSQQPPAYRTGGEYIVGGHGGVDSQTVAMRATPGEKISINTPRQASAMERMVEQLEKRAGSDRPMQQSITVVQTGKPDNKTPEHNARAMRRGAQRLMRTRKV